MAAIIRKGLKKEAIKFRGSSFILSLPNHMAPGDGDVGWDEPDG